MTRRGAAGRVLIVRPVFLPRVGFFLLERSGRITAGPFFCRPNPDPGDRLRGRQIGANRLTHLRDQRVRVLLHQIQGGAYPQRFEGHGMVQADPFDFRQGGKRAQPDKRFGIEPVWQNGGNFFLGFRFRGGLSPSGQELMGKANPLVPEDQALPTIQLRSKQILERDRVGGDRPEENALIDQARKNDDGGPGPKRNSGAHPASAQVVQPPPLPTASPPEEVDDIDQRVALEREGGKTQKTQHRHLEQFQIFEPGNRVEPLAARDDIPRLPQPAAHQARQQQRHQAGQMALGQLSQQGRPLSPVTERIEEKEGKSPDHAEKQAGPEHRQHQHRHADGHLDLYMPGIDLKRPPLQSPAMSQPLDHGGNQIRPLEQGGQDGRIGGNHEPAAQVAPQEGDLDIGPVLQAKIERLEQQPDRGGPEGQQKELTRAVLEQRLVAQAVHQKVQHKNERPPEKRINAAVKGFYLREEEPVAQRQSHQSRNPEVARVKGDSLLLVRHDETLSCVPGCADKVLTHKKIPLSASPPSPSPARDQSLWAGVFRSSDRSAGMR